MIEEYNPNDPVLVAKREQCRNKVIAFNETTQYEDERRKDILMSILNIKGRAYIEPPFSCEYGSNVILEDTVYFNFNPTLIDAAPIYIGSMTKCGPNVVLTTVKYPDDPELRRRGVVYKYPITIGSDCWLGGGVVVCAGVTIGKGCVIGAGSVVTRDVPDYSLAAGNPAKVLKKYRNPNEKKLDEK